MTWIKLESNEDCSVNWTKPTEKGIAETRYVRRREDYFIIYLSSQTGCNQGCKMCHLTAMKQTRLEDITLSGFLEQAEIVFDHYDSLDQLAQQVHFNFMARGEPLANAHFLKDNQVLFENLGKMARDRGLYPRFLVSTILPNSLTDNLIDVFPVIHPDLYYSIYSLKEGFRKRWLPRAHSGFDGLRMLKKWQRYTKKVPKLHFAFIDNENDSEAEIGHLAQIIKDLDLRVDWNVVRYNPPSGMLSKETDEGRIYELTHVFREVLPETKVKIVPRVGFDVKASCGMFVPKSIDI